MNIRPQYLGEFKIQRVFYSEDWNEVQQEEDKWQVTDKWQRILQMVLPGGGLDINPVGYRSISSPRTQYQGGRCSISAE